jgi:hypothetical protein
LKEEQMRLRVTFMLVALAALEATAQADSIIADVFLNVGIYYGSAELFSPEGTLLSTTLAMTAETQSYCPGPQVNVNACETAMAQAVLQGISNPPPGTPPLPPVFSQDFASQLPALADNNGLGYAAPAISEAPFDPNNAPTPASNALYADLATQPGNFDVTGDTGFVEYGGPIDYIYEIDVTLPVPAELPDGQLDANGQSCCVTNVEGVIAVQFFERDLQLTQSVATPEPRETWLTLVVILLLWLARRKTARLTCADRSALPPRYSR